MQLFDSWDEDRGGSLDLKELKTALTGACQAAKIFNATPDPTLEKAKAMRCGATAALDPARSCDHLRGSRVLGCPIPCRRAEGAMAAVDPAPPPLECLPRSYHLAAAVLSAALPPPYTVPHELAVPSPRGRTIKPPP